MTHKDTNDHGDRDGDLQVLGVHRVKGVFPAARLTCLVVTMPAISARGTIDESGLEDNALVADD